MDAEESEHLDLSLQLLEGLLLEYALTAAEGNASLMTMD